MSISSINLPRSEPARAKDQSTVHMPKTAEVVADRIRRLIARGALRDGAPLPPEQRLMEEFSISRPTLREAFRILESESLIVIRRGARGGARVRLPDTDVASRHIGMILQLRGATLADVYDARVVIEPPLVGRLAANHSDADIVRLRHHLAFEAERVDDLPVFALATADLHQILVELAGNRTLELLVGLLEEVFQLHVTQSVARTAEDLDYHALNREALASHRKLADLIEQGLPDEAETHWRWHLEEVRGYIFRAYGGASVLDVYQ